MNMQSDAHRLKERYVNFSSFPCVKKADIGHRPYPPWLCGRT
jgi:hypothetical protein